jgi:hypothetical protein
LPARDASFLTNDVADALGRLGDNEQAVVVLEESFRLAVKANEPGEALVGLSNVSVTLDDLNRPAAAWRLRQLNLEAAGRFGDPDYLFCARLDAFEWLATAGRADEADQMWSTLSAGGASDTPFARRLKCTAAFHHASLQFARAVLTDDELTKVEAESRRITFRPAIRGALLMRGMVLAKRGDWSGSATALETAVRMAREVGINDAAAEARFALAQFHTGRLSDAAQVAERLAAHSSPNHQALAELWLAIGDAGKAREHALLAYRWAWADGEPYARYFDLEWAKALLVELGIPIPVLPPYDPANDPELPIEAEARAFLKTLQR